MPIKVLPEGHIFHVITYGKGLMGAHGSQVKRRRALEDCQVCEGIAKELILTRYQTKMIADEQYIFRPEAKKKIFHFVSGRNYSYL
ncbi:MAG: hypothetical protein U5K54_03485 [Cytophagales bacterium]|nr:hypothetical protein [Cytophagales bacterium]